MLILNRPVDLFLTKQTSKNNEAKTIPNTWYFSI